MSNLPLQLLTTLTIALVCLISTAGARTFTSADGTETIDGQLILYKPSMDTVILRLDGKVSNTTLKASAFSEADREYFEEFLVKSAKLNALKIDSKGQTEKSDAVVERQDTETFSVVVENKSQIRFENVKANYRIYATKYDADRKPYTDWVEGENIIETIYPGSAAFFTTSKSMTVTKNRQAKVATSSCSSCKPPTTYSQKPDRIIGMHLQLIDSEGDILAEHYSSNAVKAAIEKVNRNGEAGLENAMTQR